MTEKTPDGVFDAYSRYYDLLYSDKDYAAEAAYIRDTLAEYGVIRGNLLEYGSGTGRHGRLLAEMGYSVHGIERSAAMVNAASVGDGFTCEQGDIRTVNKGRTYDAVLALFHVISYLTNNAELSSVFCRANGHLAVGGMFVFDFWYSPAVYSQRPEVRIKRMQNSLVEVIRIAEPVFYQEQNRVDVNYSVFVREIETGEVSILTENHSMRHLSLPEIDLLAGATGFERVQAEEFLSRGPPGEDTWGVCAVLRKTENV